MPKSPPYPYPGWPLSVSLFHKSSIFYRQHCPGGKASISLQKCCSCRSCHPARGWWWLLGCAPYKAWRVAYPACGWDTSLKHFSYESAQLWVQFEHYPVWDEGGPKIGDFEVMLVGKATVRRALGGSVTPWKSCRPLKKQPLLLPPLSKLPERGSFLKESCS